MASARFTESGKVLISVPERSYSPAEARRIAAEILDAADRAEAGEGWGRD